MVRSILWDTSSRRFLGTKLITMDWGDSIDGFVGHGAKQWILCYSSFVDDATSPQVFHSQCDAHQTTVTVARNSLGYTFGGYAVNSWNVESCCQIAGNDCMGNWCVDRTTTTEFVFRLGGPLLCNPLLCAPATPQSYSFNQDSGQRTRQYTCPTFWPAWGAEAYGLTIGGPYVDGNCNGYPGICHDDQDPGICHGDQDGWGNTSLEVFYPANTTSEVLL